MIALRSIAHSVGRAVDLDRERRFMTEEVEDIGPERMLPSEAEVCGTIPENIP